MQNNILQSGANRLLVDIFRLQNIYEKKRTEKKFKETKGIVHLAITLVCDGLESKILHIHLFASN